MVRATRALWLASACGASALFCLPAHGQAAAPSATAPDSGSAPASTAPTQEIPAIVVTAQRRSENIQNVPIAITALAGPQLATAGISATNTLTQLTPGLNYTVAGGAFAQPKIRGIGTSSNGPGIENPVATYVDGVYISAMSGALLTLSDVQQVAVLKGPQGTLFGRNATGGLIQITTQQPEEHSIMRFSAGYGNLDTLTLSSFMNGKIADGLSANISAYYQNRGDGFGENLANGEAMYESRDFAVRGKIRWRPTPQTTITLSSDYAQTSGSLPGLRPVDGTFNVLGLPPTGSAFDVSSNLQPHLQVTQYGASLTVSQELNGLTLQSITAARKNQNDTHLDYDATFVPYVNTEFSQLDEQASEELQIQPTHKGRVQWIAGLYYFWARSGYDPAVTSGLSLPLGGYLVQNSFQSVNSLAAYGQATFALTDATNLTAGLRYTTDLRKLDAESDFTIPPGVVLQATPASGGKTFSAPTWRLAIDHRFSPELLAYASYNRGFKSGSFLVGSTPTTVLHPETLDAFEVGLKNDLFDRRLRLNLAGFYYIDKNIQIQLINNGLLTAYDGQGATIYGLDGDFTANVTSAFSVNGGLSLLHGRYDSFPNAFTTTPRIPVFPAPVAGPNGGNIVGVGDATGHQLQGAPEWTVDLGARYSLEVGTGRLDFNVNYYRNGGWYAEVENRLRQPAYDVTNASIDAHITDHLKLSVWSRNLFNRIYAEFLSSADVGDVMTPAEGRTFGVTLSASL